MSIVSRFKTVALATLLSSLAGSALAQTTWIMASGYPESSFLTKNTRQFVEAVEKRTDGALKIDLRTNNSLIKLDAIKRAVQSGQIQAGAIRLGVYGNEAEIYNLDNTPGVASTYDQAWTLMEASKPYFEKIFAKDGMRIVSYTSWPGQGFYTREPIKSLDDLAGLDLRIYSQQTRKLGEELGANAVILPFEEVPQAFATNMIDSLWTSAQTGVDVQAWDLVKNFTFTGTMFNKNAIIINQRAFRQLPEDVQKIVLEEGEKATERGWRLSKEASEQTENELKEHGMTLGKAPDDVLARIDEIGQELIAEWRERAKPEEIEVYENYLAAKK